MAATEGLLPVPDSVRFTEQLDTAVINQGDGTEAHREAVVIADPETTDARGRVLRAQPGLSAYGAVVRPVLPLDAFGRARTSTPTTLFDSQLQYDEMDLLWHEKLTTNGTFAHDANGAFGTLNTTTESGSAVIRQSPYIRYIPGKSQQILITFDLVEQVAGQRKRVGYYDGNNGVYVEVDDDGTVYMVLRSSVSGSVVNTEVAQASWSEDAFDGSGPSGVTLDLTKSQILAIDLEWLGTGRVRTFWIVDGAMCPAHFTNNANVINKTYMATANLPVRYEITNTSAPASAGKMRQICCTVASEGGFPVGLGFKFVAGNGIVTKAATTTAVPLLSIRPKATFNSIENRTLIIPEEFGFFPQTNAGFMRVIYNGTLGGSPSWNSANADSAVEFDIAASGISGGIDVVHEHADAGGQGSKAFSGVAAGEFAARYPLHLDIDGGNPTHFTLCFTSMSATCDAVGHIGWRELR